MPQIATSPIAMRPNSALSTLSGQVRTTSVKHMLIVGLSFLLIALVIALVSMDLNPTNVAVEVALS
jgi:hypothetical protein